MKGMPDDKHLAILQSLESTLAALYREEPKLTDYDVADAYEALLRFYKAEATQRTFTANLKDRSKDVYEALKVMSEFFLGRVEEGAFQDPDTHEPVTLDELPEASLEDVLACIKRLQSSLKLWTKEGGRQGYLNYISQFV